MPVSILEQRRIEAAFAAGILNELAAAIGEAPARGLLARAIIRLAEQTGARMAAEADAPSLDHFASLLPRWQAEDALRMEVVERDATHLGFNVTRCRYAESYREMGLGELGAVLSCGRDGAFCGGYDPRLLLTRTQTIMEGASHCDFRYEWAESEGIPEPRAD